MWEMPTIDAIFIRKWASKYDGHDEDEYHRLAIIVPLEVSNSGTISSGTFERIYDWKAPRAKSTVKWNSYSTTYAPRFQLAFSAPKHRKLPILVLDENKLGYTGIGHKLPGINVPVASTVLHFAYSSEFPIMDVRTAEVLYCACQLKSEKRGWREYAQFMSVMLAVAQQAGYPLREVDKAIFALHKCELAQCLDLEQKHHRVFATRN